MGSKLSFFSKGVICAILKEVGKLPCEIERAESLHIMEAKMPENRFSIKIGLISKGEDLFGRKVISLTISSIVGGGKNERFDSSLSVEEARRGRLIVGNELYIM